MTLSFKGEVSALPTSNVSQYDAYCLISGSIKTYKYNSNASGITWVEYNPIKLIDTSYYTNGWMGHGAVTATSNLVQLPSDPEYGSFYLDAINGDFWAYDKAASTWKKW